MGGTSSGHERAPHESARSPEDVPRLPDGRPILPPPSVPVREAAEQLGVTTDEVRAMVGQGILSATPSGAGITVPSLNRAAGRHQQGAARPSASAKGGSAGTRKRRAVSVEEAADRLRVSRSEIPKMIARHELSVDDRGRIHADSLRAAERRRRRPFILDQLDREDAEEARRIERMEARERDRAAKRHVQPRDGMTGRPVSGGLPTLGRRR